MTAILEELALDFPLSPTDLSRLVLTAPQRYKIYRIAKRKTGEWRIIAQPSREVKILQYWVLSNYLKNLPIHACASAYKSGSSIRANAEKHANSQFLLKMDFKDFFPSIIPEDLFYYMKRFFILGDDEKLFLSNVLFWQNAGRLRLSIGAPSSPMISNIVMYEFDEIMSHHCSIHGVNYTRYADDLAFSTNTPGILSAIESLVEKTTKQILHPRLSINSDKTVHASRKGRRKVTGIILNNNGDVSLGRERKRTISAMVHSFALGKVSQDQAVRLSGLLAFCMDVEPAFVARLSKKYGFEIIGRILGKGAR